MSLAVSVAGTAITGAARKLQRSGFSYVNAIGQRDTLSFQVASPDGSYQPPIGGSVSAVDATIGLEFGGNIRILKSDLRGATELLHTIDCASWEQLFDRRVTGVYSFRDQTAGYIVEYCRVNMMGGDAITASILETGPVIKALDFEFQTVREALDQICELASGSGDTYVWDCPVISGVRTLRFYKQDTYAAPFDITAASSSVRRPITVSYQITSDYSNRVYVRMGEYVRDPETQPFTGNGVIESFNVDYPIAATPGVTVEDADQTVGVDGVDTGKDCYWNLDSRTVRFTTAPTGAVEITYQGKDRKIFDAVQDNTAIAERAAAEGGTGYYVAVVESNTPGGSADAATVASSWLARHASIPATVEYTTEQSGLKAGMYQTITLPVFALDDTFILESVTLTIGPAGEWLWQVRAVRGALLGDWMARLRNIVRGTGNIAVGVGAPTIGDTGTGTPVAVTPPLLPDSLSAAEHAGERRAAALGRTETPIYVTYTLPTGHGAEWITIRLSRDGGDTWRDIGRWPVADTIKIWEYAPPATETNWLVKAYTGKVGAENKPEDAVLSDAFTVTAIADPAASIVTSATVSAIIDTATPEGIHKWSVDIAFTVGASVDIWLTEPYRIVGKMAGGVFVPAAWMPVDPLPEPGICQFQDSGTFSFNFGPHDYVATGGDVIVRFGFKSRSRAGGDGDQTGWIAQTEAFGAGVQYYDLDVTAGAGTLDASRLDPATVGYGLTKTATGIKAGTSNAANLIQNPGFEDGLTHWTVATGAASAVAGGAYSGTQMARLEASNTRLDSEKAYCITGQQFRATAQVTSSGADVPTLYLYLFFKDAAGTIVGTALYDSTAASVGAWKELAISHVAPASATFACVELYQGTQGADYWYVDHVGLAPVLPATQLQIAGGLYDASGSLAVKTTGTTELDGSGNVVVKQGTLTQPYFTAGALADPNGAAWSSAGGPVSIYYGLPTYTGYQLGQLLFNTADSKLYRRGASAWVKTADPADMIAGTLAAGVIYAGTIAAAKVTAGTFTGFTFVGCTMDLALNNVRTKLMNRYFSSTGQTISLETWNGTDDDPTTGQVYTGILPGLMFVQKVATFPGGSGVAALQTAPIGAGTSYGQIRLDNGAGTYFTFWVDANGKFRIKQGTPGSDTDGDVVGAQS